MVQRQIQCRVQCQVAIQLSLSNFLDQLEKVEQMEHSMKSQKVSSTEQ